MPSRWGIGFRMRIWGRHTRSAAHALLEWQPLPPSSHSFPSSTTLFGLIKTSGCVSPSFAALPPLSSLPTKSAVVPHRPRPLRSLTSSHAQPLEPQARSNHLPALLLRAAGGSLSTPQVEFDVDAAQEAGVFRVSCSSHPSTAIFNLLSLL